MCLSQSLQHRQVSGVEYHSNSNLFLYSLYVGVAVAPRNVKATVVSSTVISVQWDGLFPCRLVNGLIVKYRVQYTAESSGEVQHTDESGDWDDGGETSLTGLTPFTNYSIQVAAVNEQDDVGPYSDPAINAQTEEDCKIFYHMHLTNMDNFISPSSSWSSCHHIIVLFLQNYHHLEPTRHA